MALAATSHSAVTAEAIRMVFPSPMLAGRFVPLRSLPLGSEVRRHLRHTVRRTSEPKGEASPGANPACRAASSRRYTTYSNRGFFSMASQSVAPSESIAASIPALELLITEALDEGKIPRLAVAVVQNGEVALVRAYGLRDVEAGPA